MHMLEAVKYRCDCDTHRQICTISTTAYCTVDCTFNVSDTREFQKKQLLINST